jgi:proteasome lid subunit RPN8/RPN11
VKVFTSRSAWQGFLRRAKRAYPLEHVEALWGHATVDAFRILKFNRIRLKLDKDGNPIQTQNELEYTAKEIKRQKDLAKAAGLEFLGTVHTHPGKDDDPAASEDDHVGAVKDGEKMMGVVHLFRADRKKPFTCVPRWWFPQKPIPFEILPD